MSLEQHRHSHGCPGRTPSPRPYTLSYQISLSILPWPSYPPSPSLPPPPSSWTPHPLPYPSCSQYSIVTCGSSTWWYSLPSFLFTSSRYITRTLLGIFPQPSHLLLLLLLLLFVCRIGGHGGRDVFHQKSKTHQYGDECRTSPLVIYFHLLTWAVTIWPPTLSGVCRLALPLPVTVVPLGGGGGGGGEGHVGT